MPRQRAQGRGSAPPLPARAGKTGRTPDKKPLILKAAIKIFARHGFSRARTAAIAREARVAEGTIYNYFKSKDDIIVTIFDQTWRDQINALKKLTGPMESPLEKLSAVISSVMELFKADLKLAEVFLVEFRQCGKCFSSQPISVILEFLNLLEDILKDGIRKGMIRPDINTRIARGLLFGALENIVLAWLLRTTHPEFFGKEEPYTLDEARETLIKLYLDGFAVHKVG
ncbi:MAG TPA: TetR/AcrR family transcriptional regulator [Nitrospiria bacterium]